MTPDELAVDTWLQIAVIRVYGPWLRKPGVVPGDEHVRAAGRVGHARLMLAMRNVQDPLHSVPRETFQ
ncbi:hypothetical protein D0T12_21900 [Actinomadura spongiicola]|uniref:Uncharacterized protein n=1 Tax=Actinomadura spongiicola TaxID=2303421 RepID=A0A372GEA6_9ACTN|nr:hypothetical protein [Actinomadura spongiicola]RFS83670.1 hypothetical protein D0T12_21900 [Actinomadura spongiicola]